MPLPWRVHEGVITCWLGKAPFKGENPLFRCSGLADLLGPVLCLPLLSISNRYFRIYGNSCSTSSRGRVSKNNGTLYSKSALKIAVQQGN